METEVSETSCKRKFKFFLPEDLNDSFSFFNILADEYSSTVKNQWSVLSWTLVSFLIDKFPFLPSCYGKLELASSQTSLPWDSPWLSLVMNLLYLEWPRIDTCGLESFVTKMKRQTLPSLISGVDVLWIQRSDLFFHDMWIILPLEINSINMIRFWIISLHYGHLFSLLLKVYGFLSWLIIVGWII